MFGGAVRPVGGCLASLGPARAMRGHCPAVPIRLSKVTDPKVSSPRKGTATCSPADAVHPLVRMTAEWSWRLLVIFAVVLAISAIVQKLATGVLPLAIALLAAGLLAPLVDWMQRLGVPRAVGVFVALAGSLGLVAGI